MIKTNQKPDIANKDLKSVFQRGVSMHRQGKMDDALELYHEVLTMQPDYADALYLAGVIHYQAGKNETAGEYIRKAMELNTSNPEYGATLAKVCNNLGLSFQEKGDTETAGAYYREALELDENLCVALNNLGMIHQENKEFPEAAACYEKAVQADAGFYPAWVNCGLLFQETGRPEDALGCFRRALALDSDSCDLCIKIGVVLKEQEFYDDAAAMFEKAISINPDSGEAFFNLGNLYKERRRFEKALACYNRAIIADVSYSEAYCNAGGILLEMNNTEGALKSFLAALNADPENGTYLYNSGLCYLRIKAWDSAFDCLTKALEKDPESSEINYTLGILYKGKGDYAAAYEALKKAVDIDPGSVRALDQLIAVSRHCCFWNGYENMLSTLIQIKKETNSPDELPFHSLARYENPAQLFEVASAFSREIVQKNSYSGNIYDYGDRSGKDKIRLGYLSNTFSDHPGGHLIAGLFGFHDRERFEVFCYSYGPNDGSYYRNKIEQTCDAFIDITHLDNPEAGERIFRDNVDILIDLRGHTTDSRPGIDCLRPAPVQVVWLGFPGTSGAGFFDYLIADPTTVPPGEEKYYSETVVRMPVCYQVNDITQPVAETNCKRADFGLPEDGFVFCSFNNAWKIDPAMFGVWMKILKQCDRAVIWLLETNRAMAGNLKKEAEKAGVSTKRLVFSEKIPKAEHLARHSLADMGLDTRIYNGHTTTSDALIAGVPVLTVPGHTFPSRVSAAILKSAGLEELIMPDIAHYEKAALRYARNPEQVEKLKTIIRETKSKMPLFDTEAFAADLEGFFREMWEKYLETAN